MKMKGKPELYPKVILLGAILPFLDMVTNVLLAKPADLILFDFDQRSQKKNRVLPLSELFRSLSITFRLVHGQKLQ